MTRITHRFYRQGTNEPASARECLEILARNIGNGEYGWLRKQDMKPIPESDEDCEKELLRLESESSCRLANWQMYQ